MKVSKNPNNYKLFTDREENIADGNLALITEYNTPMVKLFKETLKRGGFMASPENMGWVLAHARNMNQKSYDEIQADLKTLIVEKKEKQPKTKKANNPNKVIQEVNGTLCSVDLTTGIAIPITVQKQKAVK